MTSVAGLLLVGLVGLAGAATFGCTVSNSFDPTGGDVSVVATWTVQGAPAGAESCAAANIRWVQLRVWEQYAGGDDYTEDAWLVECAQGTLTTDPTLVAGTYRVALYGVEPQDLPDMAVPDLAAVEAAAITLATAGAGESLRVAVDLASME